MLSSRLTNSRTIRYICTHNKRLQQANGQTHTRTKSISAFLHQHIITARWINMNSRYPLKTGTKFRDINTSSNIRNSIPFGRIAQPVLVITWSNRARYYMMNWQTCNLEHFFNLRVLRKKLKCYDYSHHNEPSVRGDTLNKNSTIKKCGILVLKPDRWHCTFCPVENCLFMVCYLCNVL